MSNSTVYDGSKRTKVIIARVDNLTKHSAAKERIQKRYDYLNTQVQNLMEQFNTTDDISKKQSIRNQVESIQEELKTLKKWNSELDTKRSELEEATKADLESWKPNIPTL